jgi:DNA-binding transcriptional LysR family regulator
MILYNHMAIFASIAREQGISATAEQLGMPKSTVSLRLRELEEELGVRLIQRTTRQMKLTEHGRLFYEQCMKMLEMGDAAIDLVRGLQDEPRGKLKISCPFGMSETVVPKIIDTYTARYPQVRVELLASNERVDIIREGIDVAMRLGVLEDSSLIARKVNDSRRWALASPAYLERHGTPQKPKDLLKHRCIVSAFTPRWGFYAGKRVAELAPEPYIKVTDVVMARKLAVDGVGICMLPDLMIGEELEEGSLVRLLPDYPMETRPWNLVFPSRNLPSASVKCFVDVALEIYGEVSRHD